MEDKLDILIELMDKYDSAVIAFSGGVDRHFLPEWQKKFMVITCC